MFNTVNCQPMNNWLEGAPWEMDAVHCCRSYVDFVVQQTQPRLIMSLGGVATRNQTGLVGKKTGVSNIRGFLTESLRYKRPDGSPIPVMPTFHPSYLARGKPSLTGVLRHDISNAVRWATRTKAEGGASDVPLAGIRPQIRVLHNPDPQTLDGVYRDARSNPHLHIYYDIETEESVEVEEGEIRAAGDGRVLIIGASHFQDENAESATDVETILEEPNHEIRQTRIKQIQFCIRKNVAVVLDFVEPFIGWSKKLMRLSNPRYGVNCWHFDDPLLAEAGFTHGPAGTPGARSHDIMWMWHAWQPDLPRGLQFIASFFAQHYAPWKHLSDSDPEFYGACDVTAPAEIVPGLVDALHHAGVWESYNTHVYRLSSILEGAEQRGIPQNRRKQKVLDLEIEKVQAEVLEKLQEKVPVGMRTLVQPKDGYANDATALKMIHGVEATPGKEGKIVKRRIKSLETGELSVVEKRVGVRPPTPACPPAALGPGEIWEQRWFEVAVGADGKPVGKSTKSTKPVSGRDTPAGNDAPGQQQIEYYMAHGWPESQMAGAGTAQASAQTVAGSGLAKIQKILRWCRVQPFNPNSSKQLLAYMQTRGYEIPKDLKTRKPTTGKEALVKLGKKYKDGLFVDCLEYRQYSKIRSTYMWPLSNETTIVPGGPEPGGVELKDWRAQEVTPVGWFKVKTATGGWTPKVAAVHWDSAHHDLAQQFSYEELKRRWFEIGWTHTTFTHAPATHQLSSRGPNIQNAPKHGDIAKAWRGSIEAPPGYVLLEADYRAYHALTLGFEAECAEYMWLAAGDIHSFVAGHLLKVPGFEKWGEMAQRQDKELLQILKWWNSDKTTGGTHLWTEHGGKTFNWIRNKKAKPAILGIGFGLGDFKMWQMNPDSYSSRKDAGSVRRQIKELFPAVFAFQDHAREEAFENKKLRSMHGCHRWFWDVYHWQRVADNYDPKYSDDVRVGNDGQKYKKEWGEDSESSIAYRPANDAFCHKKLRMIAMDDKGMMDRYGFANDLHDALFFICKWSRSDECIADVKTMMEARSPILVNRVAQEGLRCEVEVMVGRNWAEMKKVA